MTIIEIEERLTDFECGFRCGRNGYAVRLACIAACEGELGLELAW